MKRVMITLLTLYIGAFAAAPPLIIPPSPNTTVEIVWTAAPVAQDIGIAETIWLDALSFSTGGTARAVTIADRNTVPVLVLNNVSLSANQLTVITLPAGGMRMEKGFTITTSGAGVFYQFRGRLRR